MKPVCKSIRCYRWRCADETGQSAVLFVLALTILLGFAALALDGSNAYLQQQRMQIAADAAALAGARVAALGGDDIAITAVVRSLSGRNGATTVTWGYTASRRGIFVIAARDFPTFFGQILARPAMTVRAESAAVVHPLSSASTLLPMTISCDRSFTYGQVVTIWDKDAKIGAGGFGWLDWNGGARGNPELIAAILNPAQSGSRRIGDWVHSGPGVQNSSGVKNALTTWIGKPITIPLYDQASGSGANLQYRICGFAQFTLVDFDFQGNPKYVRGSFIRTLRPGDASDPSAPDRGVYGIVLAR